MVKNQKGFTIVAIVIVVTVVAILGSGAILLLKNSNPKSTGTSGTVVEGQVTKIINQGGDTCLTYLVNTSDYIAVQCPDMAGYKGFTGNYDTGIKVGDKVTAYGTPKNPTSSTHKTYQLDKPDTYLRLQK